MKVISFAVASHAEMRSPGENAPLKEFPLVMEQMTLQWWFVCLFQSALPPNSTLSIDFTPASFQAQHAPPQKQTLNEMAQNNSTNNGDQNAPPPGVLPRQNPFNNVASSPQPPLPQQQHLSAFSPPLPQFTQTAPSHVPTSFAQVLLSLLLAISSLFSRHSRLSCRSSPPINNNNNNKRRWYIWDFFFERFCSQNTLMSISKVTLHFRLKTSTKSAITFEVHRKALDFEDEREFWVKEVTWKSPRPSS